MEINRIDVDSHVQERPDTWTSRMSKRRWGDRIPHLEEVPEDLPKMYMITKSDRPPEGWVMDGEVKTGFPSVCQAVMADRETLPHRWEGVPKSVYEAHARLEAMDQDGVDMQALYPNNSGPSGEAFQGMEEEFEGECVAAYNDYLIDEFYSISKRFIPLAILPYANMERTLTEVKRAVGRGHKGIVMISAPHLRGLPHVNDSYWDPLWATVQDLDVVANFHGSGGAGKMVVDLKPGTSSRFQRALRGATGFNLQAQFMANFLFSGIFERFPKIRFAVAESGVGWVPYVLEACDHEWQQCQLWEHGYPTKPSDLFRQHCHIDFWYEQMGLQLRHVIGINNIMWESDFPHPTSIWPNSARYVEGSLGGVPEDERRKILVDNARRVYKI